jgi:beta-galactosidase
MKIWYENKPVLIKTELIAGSQVVSYYSIAKDSATVKVMYTVNEKGFVHTDVSFTPGVKDLPNLPKLGMQMAVPVDYTLIEYFGKGPLENYIDRRFAFDAGIYKMDIQDLMEPYVVPQENGNRTDVRWFSLSNSRSKQGLLVIADSLLSMSAWPYTEENIIAARHTNKLNDPGFITLNIDLIQMGVGGNDSWSDVAAPLPEYQVKAQAYHYSFYIVPADAASAKTILNRSVR